MVQYCLVEPSKKMKTIPLRWVLINNQLVQRLPLTSGAVSLVSKLLDRRELDVDSSRRTASIGDAGCCCRLKICYWIDGISSCISIYIISFHVASYSAPQSWANENTCSTQVASSTATTKFRFFPNRSSEENTKQRLLLNSSFNTNMTGTVADDFVYLSY